MAESSIKLQRYQSLQAVDLIANEAGYHNMCRRAYMRVMTTSITQHRMMTPNICEKAEYHTTELPNSCTTLLRPLF